MGGRFTIALPLVVYVAVQHGLKYRQLVFAGKGFLLLCSNLEPVF